MSTTATNERSILTTTASECLTSARTNTLPRPRLRRVTEYIATHLDQELTLARLGAVACMSPYHFARLFQRSTGLPPHRFVLRERINQAALLLTAPAPPVAEVARVVGFRSASHFSSVFRRLTGVTPRAFRVARRDDQPIPHEGA